MMRKYGSSAVLGCLVESTHHDGGYAVLYPSLFVFVHLGLEFMMLFLLA